MTAQPESPDTVYGTEPWDLLKILQQDSQNFDLRLSKSAEMLRDSGPSGLPKEDRAFWLSYMNESKSPLPPTTGQVDLTPAHVSAAVAAFKQAKPDVKELETALDQTEHSTVIRQGGVGLFAKRGPIRVVSLPDWCKVAICVNTKARYWEVLTAGQHKLIRVVSVVPQFAKGEWMGHQQRIRQSGLPDMRSMSMVFSAMVACHQERGQA
jgi:hypothetical protein